MDSDGPRGVFDARNIDNIEDKRKNEKQTHSKRYETHGSEATALHFPAHAVDGCASNLC